MSQRDDTVRLDGENGQASGQDSAEAIGDPEELASAEHPRPADVAPEAPARNLTVETLNRYLAVAAEDREAAEERSAEIIARFSKLTIAMMCVTMVIAGANVAMIIRQSSVARPVLVAPPRPMEAPTLVVQPVQPVLPATAQPMPTEPPREMVKPAENIPLLGSPPKTKDRWAPVPGPTRLARTPIAPPRSQPLLSARNVDDDSRDSSPVERW